MKAEQFVVGGAGVGGDQRALYCPEYVRGFRHECVIDLDEPKTLAELTALAKRHIRKEH